MGSMALFHDEYYPSWQSQYPRRLLTSMFTDLARSKTKLLLLERDSILFRNFFNIRARWITFTAYISQKFAHMVPWIWSCQLSCHVDMDSKYLPSWTAPSQKSSLEHYNLKSFKWYILHLWYFSFLLHSASKYPTASTRWILVLQYILA